jgi:TRAP-type C4-dicarboxylate transport system substrate-binding protein
LFSTYVAKKRAEVAPTVGKTHTDLFFVGTSGYQSISNEIHEAIKKAWETLELDILLNTETANQHVLNFLNDHLRQRHESEGAARQTEQPSAQSQTASPAPEAIAPPRPDEAPPTEGRSTRKRTRKTQEPL